VRAPETDSPSLPGAAKPPLTPPATQAIRLFLMSNSFETGGSERQFAVLAQSLKPEQFQLSLGCIRRIGPLAAALGDVPEFQLGGSLYGWKSLTTRVHLSRHLRRNHVQVAHAFDFYTNLTLIPAARLAWVPVVIGSFRQAGDLLTPTQFRAQTAAFHMCDAVVCNSQAGADSLAAAGLSREKLVVIGNALDDAAFATVPPTLGRRPGLVRVCMVARMNAGYKNHRGFLRIASQIHRHMPGVEFLLVGDGPFRPELEQYAAGLGLGGAVVFLGERYDIPALLASADVAVLTSESEGLSNAILEAMAARLPVVAFAVGGNAELVNGERGALIRWGEEERFAEAVQRLLADASLRRELGMNAFKFAEKNFSLDLVRHRYEALYETLLRSKSRRNIAS
jgi:L-malate glycosyltransferase